MSKTLVASAIGTPMNEKEDFSFPTFTIWQIFSFSFFYSFLLERRRVAGLLCKKKYHDRKLQSSDYCQKKCIFPVSQHPVSPGPLPAPLRGARTSTQTIRSLPGRVKQMVKAEKIHEGFGTEILEQVEFLTHNRFELIEADEWAYACSDSKLERICLTSNLFP